MDHLEFAVEKLEERDADWLEKLIRSNLCEYCNESVSIDLSTGDSYIPGHCGMKILMLWRIVMFTEPYEPGCRDPECPHGMNMS
jgi:hypothetical protein